MSDEAVIGSESSSVTRLFAWLALLMLGTLTILADRWLAAPAAAPAKQALRAAFDGDISSASGNLAPLLVYGATIVLAPLIVLAGFVGVEAWSNRKSAPGHQFALAWVVQAVFLTMTNFILILIAQTDLRPEPLIQIERDPSSPLYWLSVVPLFLLSLMLIDVLVYWIHRAQHHFAFLWRFHAIHHSQKVDTLHNINHPIEMVTNYLLAIVPVSLLVRVEATELLLLAAFFGIQGKLNHIRSPINLGPLGALLSDNRYHLIHHSIDPADFDSNFAGRFPIIDKVFGTYRRPRIELPLTGLPDRESPTTLLQYLLARWPEQAGADRPPAQSQAAVST
jgi:sterol desaturase/sphingolipid hydroxylase (fatty acid hydroxylase superfamily)